MPELKQAQHAELLLQIAFSSVPLTQKDLAGCLQIDKSRMAMLIAPLYAAGLITVTKMDMGKRANYLSLTATAQAMMPRFQSAINQASYLLKQGLSDGHIIQFDQTILQMEMNLKVLP